MNLLKNLLVDFVIGHYLVLKNWCIHKYKYSDTAYAHDDTDLQLPKSYMYYENGCTYVVLQTIG